MDSRLHDDSTPMTCGAWKGKPLDGKSVIQQIGRFAKGSYLTVPECGTVPIRSTYDTEVAWVPNGGFVLDSGRTYGATRDALVTILCTVSTVADIT
jgi:hypothetical protein